MIRRQHRYESAIHFAQPKLDVTRTENVLSIQEFTGGSWIQFTEPKHIVSFSSGKVLAKWSLTEAVGRVTRGVI